jgi:predicted Zn finger-like uncharacterized protein
MQIICPNCETSYQVDASSMGPSGRSVRCARCQTVWFATNGAAMQEIAAAHRAEMAQFATAALGADEGLEWPQPRAAAAEQMGGEPDPGLDPADAGFVYDAPPIASGDSAASDDPFAGYDVQSAGNAPVVESPALAPIAHETAAGDIVVGEDIETVAARRAKAQAGNWRLRLPWTGWPIAMLALALLDVGLIGWRSEMVRLAPQTASLYGALGLAVNLRGLVIDNVTTETRTAEGVPVVSTAKRTVEVPRLRFAVRNGTGNEIYTWTALPNRSLLSPGEILSFQSRLAAPPPETHDVLVRFFNRHDLGIGIE